MASMASMSRLDDIVKGKLHLPLKTIGCQELLRKQGTMCNGWLQKKRPWKIPGNLATLLPSLAWERKYVIVHDGCMYFYNSYSDTKPDKALSLFGYTRVMRAGELRTGREALWPFKVAYVLDQKDRVHYFSASSEDEMKNWLKHIRRELYRANDVKYSEEDDSSDNMDDLETPISTGNYFNEMKDLNRIRDVIRDDSDESDLDDEYDYIDEELPSPFRFAGPKKAVSAPNVSKAPAPPKKQVKSQNQVQISTSNPVIHSPPATASTGYYPVPKSQPALPNKMTPLKAVVSQSPATGKVPPATPVKQKLKVNMISSPAGNSESSQQKNSEVVTASSSVANMRALFGNVMGSPANLSSSSSKPSAESPAPKPLPPLPLSARPTSNAPTAIVSPVRQSTPKPPPSQMNRYARDLESEAMWTRGAGDGQRLLISLGQEGVYMIRQCTDGASALTLLVIAGFQLRKYKVFKNGQGMYSLLTNFDPVFDSVHNLLNYYRTNCLPLRQTKLTSAYTELSNSR